MNISRERITHQYGDLEQPLKIESDMPNLVLTVPEQPNDHPGASQ
jgi:hypothetical protein